MQHKNKEWLKVGAIRCIPVGLMVLIALTGRSWPLPLVVVAGGLALAGAICVAFWERKHRVQSLSKPR